MSDQHELDQTPSSAMSASRFRLLESYVWALVAVAIGGRVLFFSIRYPADVAMIFREFYWDIVIAGLVFIFPIVFRLIFGVLPLEFLRLSRIRSQQPTVVVHGDYVSTVRPREAQTQPNGADANTGKDFTAQALLLDYAVSSRNLAKGIYGRAGVYLLIGVLVAFSGLLFFYSQTGGVPAPPEAGAVLLTLAPKFGILFFIEFVAFFFLRQYRSAMDEFRYYEAVARTREEVVALLGVAKEAGSPLQPMELIKYDSFFSKGGVLSKGQTTEIIETRRMEKSELDLLEKIVETLARAKKTI